MTQTALDIALGLIGRCWNPVPIPYRTKKPIDDQWQRRVIDAATAPQFFNGGPFNIGVILGSMSNGLTDIDLDCPEAIAIAPYILPITKAIFGRRSKRNSHYLYTTSLADTAVKAVIRFVDPKNKSALLELRTGSKEKGAQTVFPGSTHEGGEPIKWEVDGEPAAVDGDVLHRRVRALAAYTLLARHWPRGQGNRHNCALVLGGFLARANHTPKQARLIVEAICRAASDEEWDNRRKTAEDAANEFQKGGKAYGVPSLIDAFGKEVAGKVVEWLGYKGGGGDPDKDADGDAPGEALITMKASDATLRAIQWLWQYRFALGKIGLLVGLPDEGKGQIFCDIAARVTRGDGWPCDEGKAPQGSVILLTAEDDIDDTVAPRLEAAGADRSKIEIIKMVKSGPSDRMFSSVTDLELLRKRVTEIGDVKLILIDPLSAYLGVGKIDSFRTTDVRAVMGPLVALASELGVAIIAIMHFNKKVDVTNALLRISDSMAFGATARHVWAAIDDSENQRKLLVKGKNNLAPSNIKALSYGFGVREVGKDPETGEVITAPHIVWFGHVDVSATEAMQAASESKSPGAKDEARKFLTDILAEGAVLSTEIDEAAHANGISEATLRRAKRDLGLSAKKDGPKGEWRWHPPQASK